jgi:hypothetical protein
MRNKELIDYLRENPTSEIMCRAADVIESQERIISAILAREIKLPPLWIPSAFKNSYSKKEMTHYSSEAVISDRYNIAKRRDIENE